MAARFLIPFVVLLLVQGGCILPNRLAEEDPFREDIVGFIEPGITSRANIEQQLGNLYLASSNGRWWAFPADRRMTEWFWIFCMPGGCGGSEFGGDVHRYYLIIDFGNDDVVHRTVVVTDHDPCIVDQSICYKDGELTIEEGGGTKQFALEYDLSRTPCAFLLSNNGHESAGFLGELLDSPGTACPPILTMRDGVAYAFEATEPYTGQLTVYGIDGVGWLQRSYERGIMTGIETAWSESGEKLYEANYRDNRLHGVVRLWNPDGTTTVELCFENGDVIHRDAADCD